MNRESTNQSDVRNATRQRALTVVLLVGLLFGAIALGATTANWRLPDNQQGYSPRQPIDYSHQLHAGELQIDCRFCHASADKSRHAGIPSSDVCMKCHTVVTAPFDVVQKENQEAAKENREPRRIVSSELRKLYDSLRLDENLKPKPGAEPHSIPWVRVHDLPDYVYFDHSAHVAAGVTCQHCHGPVESMARVRQFETLSMGWCVNCHRDATETGVSGRKVNASTNCSVCHY